MPKRTRRESETTAPKRFLLSKASLAVCSAASDDKTSPDVHRLHIEPDGSTVAGDGSALLAVGPVDEDRAGYFPPNDEPSATPPEDGVGISPAFAAKVSRGMPASSRASLQFAQMTRCDDTSVEMMTTDGIRRDKPSTPPQRRKFPNWKKAVKAAKNAATTGRVCVDAKSLIRWLQAAVKASQDRGTQVPVFISFGSEKDALFMRADNPTNRQRIIGYVVPLDTGGGWMNDDDEWEKGVVGKEGEE
jgi:hypothetical protein